jgi:hypothetical protein
MPVPPVPHPPQVEPHPRPVLPPPHQTRLVVAEWPLPQPPLLRIRSAPLRRPLPPHQIRSVVAEWPRLRHPPHRIRLALLLLPLPPPPALPPHRIRSVLLRHPELRLHLPHLGPHLPRPILSNNFLPDPEPLLPFPKR